MGLRHLVGAIFFDAILCIASVGLVRLLTRLVEHLSSDFAFDGFASKILSWMATTTFILAVTTFSGLIATDTFILLKGFASANRETQNEN